MSVTETAKFGWDLLVIFVLGVVYVAALTAKTPVTFLANKWRVLRPTDEPTTIASANKH